MERLGPIGRAASARTLHLALAAFALLLGCGSGNSDAPAPGTSGAVDRPPAQQPAAPAVLDPGEARALFASRCSSCHGAEGLGDGPASAGLTPKPRNFQDAAWQQSVSDEHIERVIAYGGAAVGRSPIMPAHPDLASRPEVLAGLRAHIRSLGQ